MAYLRWWCGLNAPNLLGWQSLTASNSAVTGMPRGLQRCGSVTIRDSSMILSQMPGPWMLAGKQQLKHKTIGNITWVKTDSVVTGIWAGWMGYQSLICVGVQIFLLVTMSRPAVGLSSQLSSDCQHSLSLWGASSQDLAVITHLDLVPSLNPSLVGDFKFNLL